MACAGRVARSMGRIAKLDMASTIKARPAFAQTAATASSGLRMPVVVSQWTTATWVISGEWVRSSARAMGSTGWSSSNRRALAVRPMRSQIFSIRSP